jgi:hypothetical protein
MTAEAFEQTLRQFKYRQPFQGFVIEKTSGERVEIDNPDALVFSGGSGGFLSATFALVEFSCEDVRSIRPIPQEASS